MLQPPKQADVTYSAGQADPIAPLRAALQGHYEIEREIGQGAFATVYLARDLKHERKVAIKVLNADPTSETGELRFIREIRMLARLQHPNILPLHDSGHVETLLYYVMPYVSGDTLRDRIDRQKQLPIDAACSIARDVADALAYAHAQGVIHRDIKPENILLSTGHPILADFGIARAIDLAGVRQLTRTGMGSPGTPAYMSPEQLLGDQELDARSDTYSLGCVLYEMLTGKPPFAGKEGFVKRFTEPPPRVSAFRAGVPAWMDAAVAKSLERSPEARFPNAREFVTALSHSDGMSASSAKAVAAGIDSAASQKAADGSASGNVTVRSWPVSSQFPSMVRAHKKRAFAASLALLALVTALTPGLRDSLLNALGLTAAIDANRIAVIPFAGSAQPSARIRATSGIYTSLSDWRDLRVVGDEEIAAAIASQRTPLSAREAGAIARKLGAGRFIWGRVNSDDSTRARIQLYDATSDLPISVAEFSTAADEASRSRATMALLQVPGRPADAAGGDGRTKSYPAWIAYGLGHLALSRGDLEIADKKFQVSEAEDAAFAAPKLWRGQLAAWKNPGQKEEWRDKVSSALRAPSGLADRDKMIASALSRLADKAYPEACAVYSQLVASDSLDFVGLYGLGQCKSLDSLVLSSTASPSGYEFRSRYFDAAGYFMSALRVNPGANSFFSFDKLQELLPIASTKTRRGRNPAGQEFAAYPTILKDSVVFVPYPLGKFAQLPAAVTAAGHSSALARNLDVLFDFTSEWTKTSPRNPSAYRALADVLDARGEISRSRTGGMSALAAAQKARELSTSRRDTVLGATREAWLRFKLGEFERARHLTDSILGALVNPSRDEADAVVGLAALTGKIAKMSELTRSPYTYAAAVSNVPVAVSDAAAPFFTFAALGLCGEATDRLEKNLDQQLARYVAEDQQAAVTASVKTRPLTMLAPCSGANSSLRIAPSTNRLVRLQQALAKGDTASLKSMLAALAADSRSQRPGDIALDFTYQIAWLAAAVGDTSSAVRLLDRSLGALPSLSAPSLREPAAAAAVGRAMMLRADIAATRGELDEKTKWSSAVVDLWATSDKPLQANVARMRGLARATGSH